MKRGNLRDVNLKLLLPFLLVFVLVQGEVPPPVGTKWSCKTTREGATVSTVCSGLENTTLEPALQQISSDTTNLTITNSKLTRLSNGGFNFPNLAYVTSILIGPCGITAVSDGAFFGLRNISSIRIDGNPFYYIPNTNQWPEQLPLLNELHITHSNVKIIEDEYFSGTTLHVLNLSFNHIEFVEDRAFLDSPSIRYLYLSNNWLTTISDATFYGLKNLRHLDLSDNFQIFDSIYVSEKPFRYLGNLESLNLANTSRKEDLPTTLLSGTPKLKYLNLQKMNIAEFPSKILEPFADNKPILLDLSFNSIQSITQTHLKPFSSLNKLYLRGTHLRTVEESSWSHLVNLSLLDVSDNIGLKLRGNALAKLKKLEYLYIRGLLMGNISDTFFQGLGNLKVIDLSKNNLTEITAECLQPVSSARICFSENPWDCDCSMLPLKTWILQEQLDFNITCHSPPEVRGEQLKDVENATLCRVPYIKNCCHQSIEAYDGSDVTARCIAWGDPVPVITWAAIDGDTMPINRTFFKDRNQTMIIKDLTLDNAGNFSCTASNRMGNKTMVFELTVLRSSVIKSAEIIIIASVAGIVVFALGWLICFLVLKQRYFVYKPYIDDDSYEEPGEYLSRGIQVRVCD